MKRFWTEARPVEAPDGWSVELDGKPVRTPARRTCVLPSLPMAERVAAEWNAQDGDIAPLSMPMTRAAATCLDRVAPEQHAVCEIIAGYGGTDLVCYRAAHPDALVARQREGWDQILDWARDALDVPLNVGAGVMHIAQPPQSMARLAGHVARLDAWELTALSELVTISGSLVLGLAVGHRHLDPEDAWVRSQIDEQWNIDQWGEDADAAEKAARRKADFLHAAEVWRLLDERGG